MTGAINGPGGETIRASRGGARHSSHLRSHRGFRDVLRFHFLFDLPRDDSLDRRGSRFLEDCFLAEKVAKVTSDVFLCHVAVQC